MTGNPVVYRPAEDGEGARDTLGKFKSVSRRCRRDFIDFDEAQRLRHGIGLIEKLENLNMLVKTNGEDGRPSKRER